MAHKFKLILQQISSDCISSAVREELTHDDEDGREFLRRYFTDLYSHSPISRAEFETMVRTILQDVIFKQDEFLRHYGGNVWYYHMKHKYPDGKYPPDKPPIT